MVIAISPKKIILFLFRNFDENNTVSSIAKELSMNRVGIWRTIKKLESQTLAKLIQLSNKKTDTYIIKLNWDNILLEKLLSVYLTEEALKQQEWMTYFKKIENIVDFLIFNQNNVISVVPNKRIKIQQTSDLEEAREIKAITELEFMQELIKPNKDFVDAVKKGNILFGQEKFIQLMKQIHLKSISF